MAGKRENKVAFRPQSNSMPEKNMAGTMSPIMMETWYNATGSTHIFEPADVVVL